MCQRLQSLIFVYLLLQRGYRHDDVDKFSSRFSNATSAVTNMGEPAARSVFYNDY